MIVDMNISLCAYRTDSHWDTVLCFCNDAETVAAMLLFLQESSMDCARCEL